MIENLLRNLNLFVDGRGYSGKVKQLTPPKLTVQVEKYRAGGMDSAVDIDMGMEQLEASWTMSSVDAELLKQFGLVAENGLAVTMRGALKGEDGTDKAAVVHLRGQVKEVDWGDWEPGKTSETKYMMSARYYKLEHGGEVIHEIDVENMTRVINGVDQLAGMRASLGL